MSRKKITIEVDRGTWEKYKSLTDYNDKPNAIYHLRRAMALYLKVLETEDPVSMLFEDQDSEEGIHANRSMVDQLS